jgi:hypothetical protein
MTRAFRRYPICWGPLDQSDSGSGHATYWVWAMLQLAIRELQYVLQDIFINKIIKKNSVFIAFFSSLSTNHNWHHTAMAATGRNGPLAPHMRPCTPHRHIEWMDKKNPSKLMHVLGELRVCMALKALLCSGNDESPQHQSVLRAIHTLNSPQKYTRLLGGDVTYPFNMLARSARPHVGY